MKERQYLTNLCISISNPYKFIKKNPISKFRYTPISMSWVFQLYDSEKPLENPYL
jgi:hypothetical protein